MNLLRWYLWRRQQHRRIKTREYVRRAHCITASQREDAFNIYMDSSGDLHRFCHFTLEMFNRLYDLIGVNLLHLGRHRWPISGRKSLLIFLRYLATGLSFDQLAHQFVIGKSTAAAIVSEVTTVIIKQLQPTFLNPPSISDLLNSATKFDTVFGFPRAVLALDGKHIRIVKPPNSGSSFFNYKKYYSIVLLARVDSSYRFSMVDVGGEGCLSDSSLYGDSKLREYVERLHWPAPALLGNVGNVPFVILADGGFGLSEIVLTPFGTRDLTNPERILFNKRLSSARQCVEDAFGQLVARFRLFHRPIATKLDLCRDITIAAVILHNFLKSFGPDENFENFDEGDIPRLDPIDRTQQRTAARLRAQVYRERFMRHFVSTL